MTASPRHAIAVVAYEGVDDLDLFGAHAVLAKAAQIAPERLSTRVVATTRRVLTAADIDVGVAETLDDLSEERAVVVPGGQGADWAASDKRVRSALRRAAERGAWLYGVCSGSLILGGAGSISGRRVAIHHSKRDAVAAFGAKVAAGVVRDGPVCTVGGDPSTSVKSVDLAWRVLFDLLPAELVHRVAERMEIRPGRGVTEHEDEDTWIRKDVP